MVTDIPTMTVTLSLLALATARVVTGLVNHTVENSFPGSQPQPRLNHEGLDPIRDGRMQATSHDAGDHVKNSVESSSLSPVDVNEQHRPSPHQPGAHQSAIPSHHQPPPVPPQPHYPQVSPHHQVPVVPVVDRRAPGHVPPPVVGSPPLQPPPPPPHLSSQLLLYNAPSVSGEFAPDNVLEVQHEFKMTVGPAQEECLFQRARPRSRFYFSFKVLGGADGVVDVIVRSPDGNIVDQYLWSRDGTTDKFMSVGEGPFSVCIANVHSRFSARLIHVFMATYVVEEWQRFDDELRQFDVSFGNASISLQKVAKDVNDMRLRQSWSRQQSAGDYYVIRSNNVSVQFWSVAMCLLIVCCSMVQVAFVHRLFSDSSSSGRKKLRA